MRRLRRRDPVVSQTGCPDYPWDSGLLRITRNRHRFSVDPRFFFTVTFQHRRLWTLVGLTKLIRFRITYNDTYPRQLDFGDTHVILKNQFFANNILLEDDYPCYWIHHYTKNRLLRQANNGTNFSLRIAFEREIFGSRSSLEYPLVSTHRSISIDTYFRWNSLSSHSNIFIL